MLTGRLATMSLLTALAASVTARAEIVAMPPPRTTAATQSTIASPQTPSVTTEAATAADDRLHPGQGRVPLVIESVAQPQEIRETSAPASAPPLCITPCTLYVPPSRLGITVRGVGLRTISTVVDVPPGGVHIRFHAASRARYLGGVVLTSSGAVLLLSGTTLAMVGALYAGSTTLHGEGTAYEVTGGVLALVGVLALMIGPVIIATAPRGIASRDPLATSAPTVSFGPIQGGAAGTVSFRF